MGVPKLFEIKPGKKDEMVEGVDSLGVPGKSCTSPYCSKLVIDKRSREDPHSHGAPTPESEVPTTFAFVLIAAEHFDPIHLM
jgi:hypothetical protein